MVLGEKLFEEGGNITGVKVTKVHPIEGVSTEISFTSEIRGEGRFPNRENLASGLVTKYPHGLIDATWQGSLTTSGDGEEKPHLSTIWNARPIKTYSIAFNTKYNFLIMVIQSFIKAGDQQAMQAQAKQAANSLYLQRY